MHLRYHTASWLGFYTLVLSAWALLFLMGQNLTPPDGLAAWLADLCAGPGAGAQVGWDGLARLWAMWAVMGVAMMLPTAVPLLATQQRIGAGRLNWWGLLSGYLAIWVGVACVAAVLQTMLARIGLLDGQGAATTIGLQGALLLGAGIWQFTGAKSRCQSVCLSPMSYLLGRFRPGWAGGVRMGLEQGLWCVGCCWAIMALGFVGGVMNLVWMGLATGFMILEKLPQIGQALRRPAGAILMLAGLAVLAFEIGRGGVSWL